MSILYIRCTEGQLLDRRVELSSMHTKNMHRVSSIVLLVVESEATRKLKYAAMVNRAEVTVQPRTTSTATLVINVLRYTKRPANDLDCAYAVARANHKHILTAPSQRAELVWLK